MYGHVCVCACVCVCMGMCERVCMGVWHVGACAWACVSVCAWVCVHVGACACAGGGQLKMQFHYRFWSKIPPNSLKKETDPHPSSVTHLWPTQLAFVDGPMIVIGSKILQKVHALYTG